MRMRGENCGGNLELSLKATEKLYRGINKMMTPKEILTHFPFCSKIREGFCIE